MLHELEKLGRSEREGTSQLKSRLKSQIQTILTSFNVGFVKSGDLLVGPCPVHDGDNVTAFNINYNTKSRFCGRWFCNTKGCHTEYGGDELGLIHGLLCRQEKVSFSEAIKFAKQIASDASESIVYDYLTEIMSRGRGFSTGVTRRQIRDRLVIPSKFYLDRGFSTEILDEFDVGVCTHPTDDMYNRVVFPVYDHTDKTVVGSVGRTVVNDPYKWKNQKGFKKSEHLYAYAKSLPFVAQKGQIILVEGQGDVIKLWMAGIKNVFGLFGSQLSATQELMLQRTGASEVIICSDRDASGDKLKRECADKLRRLFTVKTIMPEAHDVGDMDVFDIKTLFKEFKT